MPTKTLLNNVKVIGATVLLAGTAISCRQEVAPKPHPNAYLTFNVFEKGETGFFFRSEKPEGLYTRLNSAPIEPSYNPQSPNEGTCSYVDKSVKAGGTYYYISSTTFDRIKDDNTNDLRFESISTTIIGFTVTTNTLVPVTNVYNGMLRVKLFSLASPVTIPANTNAYEVEEVKPFTLPAIN